MDAQELRRAFRRAWLLVLVGFAYCVVMCWLAIETNLPEPMPRWDMDGRPFVPASSPFADGYPMPAVGRWGVAPNDRERAP